NNTITPYARVRKEIQYGNIDLTIMYQDSRMHNYVNYIAPLPSKQIVIISLQGKPFKNIADLSGKTILHLRGGVFYDEINNDKTITQYEVNSHTLGIKMLIAGRADAMIGTKQTLQSAILKIEKEDNIKILLSEPIFLEARTPWIQVSKESNSYLDIEKLKQSFLQLEAMDTFKTLTAKYSQSAEVK
ncbi:MAG: transporter substrate-binding domain-containing protein, partial [Psychromonas sp.]